MTRLSLRGAALLTLLVVGYPLAWRLLDAASTPLAYWPVALRFLLVWWLPWRWWPALAAADILGSLVIRHLIHDSPLVGSAPWVLAVFPILAYMGAVAAVRRIEPDAVPDTPRRMGALLLAFTLAACAVSPVLVRLVGNTVRGEALQVAALLDFAASDIFGLIVLVPLLCALREGGALFRPRAGAVLEQLIALFAGVAALVLAARHPELRPHLQLIAYLPLLLIAFRQGWQATAVALAALGLVQVYGFGDGGEAAILQIRTAILGGAALVLGAAASALHAQREALEAQHAALRLAMLDQQDLARRVVHLEDEGQRQVAESLHQQVAPPLQALRTLMGMAWRGGDERDSRLMESLRDHSWQVQDGLERALRRLQPTSLASGDFRDLLAHGPLWEWAQERGAGWRTALHGNLQGLPERWKVTLYRIAQAGLEEGLAHGARGFALALWREGGNGDTARLILELSLEYPDGFTGDRHEINAIQARTLAEGGRYRCQPERGGARHHVVFEGLDPAWG